MQVWHQKLTLDVDFEHQTVWGSTEIDIVQKTADVQITLHAQQMEIESIVLISSEGTEKDEAGKAGKGAEVEVKYQNRASPEVVPAGEIGGIKEIRDIHNFTLKYKSTLSASDAGDLLIFIPTYGVMPHKVPNNHPAKEEGDLWSMWKVKIKFKLERPRGGLVFAGGVPGDVGAHMFTDGQCGGARTWFPCWDTIDACNSFDIIVNVAKEHTVLCSAPLVKRQPKKAKDDGRGALTRFHFKTNLGKNHGTVPARCIALVVGPLVQLQDPGMSQRVSHWCMPHVNGEQRLAFSTQFVSRSIETLTSLFSGHQLPCEMLNLVFVSNPPEEVEAYPGLIVASSALLYDASLLSQSFTTVSALVRGLVGQWVGLNGAVRPESRQDMWLAHGIGGHVAHVCLKRLYGNNHYMMAIMRETDFVCAHDAPSMQPLCSEAPAHPIEHSTEVRVRKAALVVRLIEKRIGEANLKKVLAQVVCKAHKGGEHAVLGTTTLFKIIKKCSGQDVAQAMHHWVLGSGCVQLTANFKLNKKRNQIEFAMRLNNQQLRAKSRHDSITLRVHETEVTYDRGVKVEAEEFMVDEWAHLSRWKRSKRDKEADREGQDDIIADIIQENDTPLLWMRVDPEMVWIRKVEMQQADYMWIYQLYKDRHVVAQIEAMEGLCKPMLAPAALPDGSLPLVSDKTRADAVRVLTSTFENRDIYHAVRARAANILGRLCILRLVEDGDGDAEEKREWVGCGALLACARAMFLDEETELPKPNRFGDLDGYMLRLGVIDALASCRQEARDKAGGAQETAEAFELLQLLLHYNDNSHNGPHSDSEYVAALLVAVARACSSDRTEIDTTLELIERYLRRELLMPSYAHSVTCAGLRAMQLLQYRHFVPIDLDFFLRHAKVGQSTQVRCAAVECLAAMTPVRGGLLLPLLRLLAVEHVALVRHALLKALLAGPAALVRSRQLLDAPSPCNIAVVNSLWTYMNEGSAYDVRSRFLAASLYTALVGQGHPECMRRDPIYADKLRDLPSDRELDALRYDPKRQSLKVKIPRGNESRKRSGGGGGGAARSDGFKSKQLKVRSEAGLGSVASPKPLILSAEDQEEKMKKQQEERQRRMRERERTLSVQVLPCTCLASLHLELCACGCMPCPRDRLSCSC